MKKITFVILLITFSLSAFAQFSIKGSIKDSLSGKYLASVNIYLEGLNRGTATNSEGFFEFENISTGNYTLKVTHIGYSEKTIKLDLTNSNELSILLIPYTIEMPSVVISATRYEKDVKDVPGRIELVTKKDIELIPANNADDLLQNISGANIDRNAGIFSKNASITLRGINSAQRTLIMLDGVSMNKTDGGSINWNRIDPQNVEKIEVIKGPVSALYGSNAMSGAINIITKSPENTSGDVGLMVGNYNTIGGKLRMNLSNVKDSKGFYGGIYSFYRQGDGFILLPDSTRDSSDVKTYLTEYMLSSKLGYRFNSNSKVELEYSYFDDMRGDGVKYYDSDGGYSKFTTNAVNLKYTGLINDYKINATAFLQSERSLQQKESVKTDKLPPYAVTQYVLYAAQSHRLDEGLVVSASKSILKNNYLTAGLEFKLGSVDASDIYYSSTDIVNNNGNMNFYALFLQDETSFLNNKLKVIAGLRFDYVRFYNGSFSIEQPTVTTEVLSPYTGNFNNANWNAISPKLSIQYELAKQSSVYFSAGRGFRPPILDDMCRNGNISKGIKLSNPELKPEKIDNYEVGANITLFKNLTIEPSVFYSLGRDFQYFVGTGDTLFSGNKPKPFLKRENVGLAEIYGAEISIEYNIMNNIELRANYGYYHSTIKEYNLSGYVAKDLTGKYLMEVAPNQVNASISWRNKIVNTMIVFHYKDKQWVDDENTVRADSYMLYDLKLSKTFYKRINASLSVENILDDVYIDEKGLLSIGRFFMAEITYKFM